MKTEKKETLQHIDPRVELVCYKHENCCFEKGCPGEHKIINNKLIFNGRCC
ncbi:MAG: hypothetical protein ACQEWU_19965 [Bacillota bacterium]|uniref:hypothetical protein n=1 Tax=unclassified Virgibacillus TaxID=2620237 RepID=UPI001D16F5DE|nr:MULTISPECIES: hypothetical protein [unclassified Virgibacillus]MCC2252807.1 hypothetical protein [Virgibacillus sp. AGTR]MDY7044869.1 hypothetical protein [Virgibacillus sp. M23]